MSRQDLRNSLEQLRAEIDALGDGKAGMRAHIERLIDDIEHQIDNPDDVQHRAGVVKGLRDTMGLFEAEHPNTTAVLNRLMITLSNMGI